MIKCYVNLKGKQFGQPAEFETMEEIMQLIGANHVKWTATVGKNKQKRIHLTAKSGDQAIQDIEIVSDEMEFESLPEE